MHAEDGIDERVIQRIQIRMRDESRVTGVVDERVESAFRFDARKRILHRVGFIDRELHSKVTIARQRALQFLRRVSIRVTVIGDGDAVVGGGEGLRHGTADAAGGAGDEDGFHAML